jgi:hypothetical protein
VIALALAVLNAAPARAAFTFADFSQSSGSPFVFTSNGSSSTLNASTPIQFEFDNPGSIPGGGSLPVGYQAATLTMSSTVTGTVVANGGSLFQPLAGTITITSVATGKNFLTVDFNGVLVTPAGTVNGNINIPPGTVSYTSDYLNFSGAGALSMGMSLPTITPTSSQSQDQYLSSFVSDAFASFNSATPPAVPEPSSIALFAGGGVVCTLALRKKARRSA